MKRRLVVARWDEDVSWCAKYPHVIYDKGGEELDTTGLYVIRLDENPGGHETHTYLHHIIMNYDKLDDWTTFCQGHPFDHAEFWHEEWKREPVKGFCWVGSWPVVDDGNGQPHHYYNRLPVAEVFERVFKKKAPREFFFFAGAQFVASREKIRSRSLAFWEELQAMGLEPDYERDWGYTVERLWGYVMNEAIGA